MVAASSSLKPSPGDVSAGSTSITTVWAGSAPQ